VDSAVGAGVASVGAGAAAGRADSVAGGTTITAEQTEQRARTPAGGILLGSSSNSVKQDEHCTTMAFIAA
jgi:hypothetical protein